jgi:hypothetical protein
MQPEPEAFEIAEGDNDSDRAASPCDDSNDSLNLVIDFNQLGADPDFDHAAAGTGFETMCDLVLLEDWDGFVEIPRENKKQRRRKQRSPSSSDTLVESAAASEQIEATAAQQDGPDSMDVHSGDVLSGSGSGDASPASDEKEVESPSSHGDIGTVDAQFSFDIDLDFEFSGESGTEWTLRDEGDTRHAEIYKNRFQSIMDSMESMEAPAPAVSKATLASQLIELLVAIQLHRRRVHVALLLRMRQDAKVKCMAGPAAANCLHASWRFREEGLLKLLEIISYDTVGRGWQRLRYVIDQRLRDQQVITYGLSSPCHCLTAPSPRLTAHTRTAP